MGNNKRADIDIKKSVNKDIATIGESIRYKVIIKNNGDYDYDNLYFIDTIANGLSFIENSLEINGEIKVGINVEKGFIIEPPLKIFEEVVVEFNVKIDERMVLNPILGVCNIIYGYKEGRVSELSNLTQTFIDERECVELEEKMIENSPIGSLSIATRVDKTYANILDTLTYTSTITNTSDLDLKDIVFADILRGIGVSFIENSLAINGEIRKENTNDMVYIKKLKKNETITIVFMAKIDRMPSPNPIVNISTARYTFTSLDEDVVRYTSSNKVTTIVNNRNIENFFNGGMIGYVDNKVNLENINKEGGFLKAVDKEFSGIGEILTYTIILNNLGNVNAREVILKDKIEEGVEYLKNSLKVDGEIFSGDILRGVNLKEIKVAEIKVISYKVKVVKIPRGGEVKSSASIFYKFKLDAINALEEERIEKSNRVSTKINTPNISIENRTLKKMVDKKYAKLYEELTYSIYVENNGNIIAEDLVITDKIPEGAKFIVGSVSVNGVVMQNENPEFGIKVQDLKIGSKILVEYKVLVDKMPYINPVKSRGSIKFFYSKNPLKIDRESVSIETNEVLTEINEANITNSLGGFLKEVDKKIANNKEVLTYLITLKNKGNMPANKVIITDVLSKELEFIKGSLRVGGVLKNGNIEKGISIGTIAPNETVKVCFKTKILDGHNLIKNRSKVNYVFTKNPLNPNGEIEECFSNEVETKINNIGIAKISKDDGGFIKKANKEFAAINEEITYKIILKNTGNVNANNVVLEEKIQKEAKFIYGSIKINGETLETASIERGIGLLVIKPSEVIEIEYKVKVIALNEESNIKSSATINYEFVAFEGENLKKEKNTSNIVTTRINSADFSKTGFIEYVSGHYGKTNDEITYTFHIENKGNVMANNVLFTNNINKDLKFVQGSLYINDINLENDSLENGINLGSIGLNKALTLSYKVKILENLDESLIKSKGILEYKSFTNPLKDAEAFKVESNIENLHIKNPKIILEKSVDRKKYILGENILYKIKVQNLGNVEVFNIVVTDNPLENLKILEDTIKIEGKLKDNVNLSTGISLKTLKIKEIVEIEFLAKIIEMPKDKVIENDSSCLYSYIIDPSKEPTGEFLKSNLAKVYVENVSLKIEKSVDLKIAKLDDILTYTIKVFNEGTVKALNLLLLDNVPKGTEILYENFEVDEKKVGLINAESGINIGDLEANKCKIIKYKVVANKIDFLKRIRNGAYLRYDYKIDENSKMERLESEKLYVDVIAKSQIFKELNVDGNIKIDESMDDISDINEVLAEVFITNEYIVRGNESSFKSNKVMEDKLVINGYIHEKIEYTALNKGQSVHYTSNLKKFSTFIIIRGDYKNRDSIEIHLVVEDVFYTKVSNRVIYTNVRFRIDANMKP